MPRLLDLWHPLQILLPVIRDYAAALGLIAAAAGVAFVAPGVRIKLAGVLAALSIIVTTIAYSVGLKRGSDRVKADWDWTLELEHREGEAARADAERAVRVEPADSGVLANDPWNCDAQPAAGGGAQGP
jgi:membrane protein implicated in regulation of membrane protease activity